ncbi:MAG: hypothetical protein Q8N60_04795 [Candidatus Diapherotrites archaeon]|nr:hypothetical protein [Candidatus Diapherotrites archaeon]
MAIEMSYGIVGIIVAVIAAVVAWKVFKFTVKKVSAVVQGLAALALIAYALTANPLNLTVAFGIAGIGILFGAISNIFG